MVDRLEQIEQLILEYNEGWLTLDMVDERIQLIYGLKKIPKEQTITICPKCNEIVCDEDCENYNKR